MSLVNSDLNQGSFFVRLRLLGFNASYKYQIRRQQLPVSPPQRLVHT